MIFRLGEELIFPPVDLAENDGLLAVGGDLSVERLVLAYSKGIFPWYSAGDPILWWSPNPRMVLFPDEFHCSKRLARTLRQDTFTVTFDRDFGRVIRGCADPRKSQSETWIVDDMISAYCELHQEGWAHSIECWQHSKLVGGVYGVAIGGCFFGESMFSRVSDSSKVAFATLVTKLKGWQFDVIDCQVHSDHLRSLGAREIAGKKFSEILTRSILRPACWGGERCLVP